MREKRKRPGSLRLTSEYRDRYVELVDVQPVDAIAPEPPSSASGRVGYWLGCTSRAAAASSTSPSSTITVSDTAPPFLPTGATGSGFLQSRRFPRAPAGTAAAA